MSLLADASTSRAGIVQGSFHHHLLLDAARVKAYRRAIRGIVRPRDVVADLGAGSGLLAGFAARAGAARVHAIELDKHAFPFLERFVAANGLEGVVVPVRADAEEWVPPGRVDVVVCEMMETGLMNEDQARVMNHVHATWPEPPRAVIPERAVSMVALARAPERHWGFRVLLPHFERERASDVRALTTEGAYWDADFTRPVKVRVDATADVVGETAGEANCVLVTTRTHLGVGTIAEPSPDHASPLVLPLDAPVPVAPRDAFRVRLAYETGSVTGRVAAQVTRA